MYIASLLFCICANAQKDLEKGSIKILANSELIIAGSTNVNKFDCKFDIQLISKPKSFVYFKDEQYLRFKDLELHLLTQGFDCGNHRMNSDFQDLLMNEKYPEIVIHIDHVELVSKEYVKAYIQVDLAGKSNKYDLPVLLTEDRIKGKFKMNIRDFGLKPPKKALGLIEVDDIIEVQFNLKISN